MKYVFHPEAEVEFIMKIVSQVLVTISSLKCIPPSRTSSVFQKLGLYEEDIRRCQIRRFPYGIIYAIDEEVLFILAVMHLHRDPECWKDRLK